VKGYRQALAAAGIPVEAGLIVEVGFTPVRTQDAVAALFGSAARPTSVVAANDQVGIAVIRALHDLGLRVPDDVSVVGFDDTPVASYTVPSLTTVAVPMYDLGQTAVRLLLDVLSGRQVSSVVLPCTLKVRESTSLHRRRD
jgi:LacI family transcriptional regulator